MNPGFEEKQRVSESEEAREEVEWTGETAEVDMEETGYIKYYRCRPRSNYYLLPSNYWLTINY